MGVGLGKDGFQTFTSCLPRNFQFSGSNLQRRAACYDAGELRLRSGKMKSLGEDRCGRPRFWPQRIQRYESMNFLLRRVRWPFAGPNSQDDREFVAALNDDRLGKQRL